MKKVRNYTVLVALVVLVLMTMVGIIVCAVEGGAKPAKASVQSVVEAPEASVDTNVGVVEATIWDDSVNPDGIWDEPLIMMDGVTVKIYRLESDGSWTSAGPPKVSGAGMYGPFGIYLPYPLGYEHGWVGWNNLPTSNGDKDYVDYVLEVIPPEGYYATGGGGTVRTGRVWQQSIWHPFCWWRFFYYYAEDPGARGFSLARKPVQSRSDLDVTKAESETGDVHPGDEIDYTLTITNDGPKVATGVVFEDAVPANTTLKPGSVSAPNGTNESTATLVKITGITVPADGGTVKITFGVTVNGGAPNGAIISNQGKVIYDPDGEGQLPLEVDESNIVTATVINALTAPTAPKISTEWYLSEGYTGKDLYYPGESFDTYILIANATQETAKVEATFMREDTSPVVKNYEVSGESRYTIHLNEVEGCANHHISTRLLSTNGVDIAAERAMYFDYYGIPGGHDSIGVTEPSSTWFLPEGYTGDNNYPGEKFNTYVLLENPNNGKASVDVTFLREGTTPVAVKLTLDPLSRHTIKVDEVKGCENSHISTRVNSDVPVIAERAMYFNYYGLTGGHESIGAAKPETEWYMPEGYTGENNYPGEKFDTYILLENPNDKTAKANATFMREGSTPVEVAYNLLPQSRFTIRLDDVKGCENAQVATRIMSDIPVVAERAMYFNYHGKIDGHDSIAATKGGHWILPEGYTGDANYPGEEFDAYVLLMNPNDKVVTAEVKFMSSPSGKGPVPNILVTRQYKLPANSRYTIHADEIPELANTAFSTEVTSMDSGSPIICERAMYFNYYGIKGGHDSIGYDP